MLAACSPTPPTVAPPVLAVSGDIPDGGVAVAKDGTTLSLWLADGTGAWTMVTSTEDEGDHATVHLISYGGETGRQTNSFVFGYAPNATASMEVGPGHVAAFLGQGVYVAALAARDVAPNMLVWTFRDAAGGTIASGTGITD